MDSQFYKQCRKNAPRKLFSLKEKNSWRWVSTSTTPHTNNDKDTTMRYHWMKSLTWMWRRPK